MNQKRNSVKYGTKYSLISIDLPGLLKGSLNQKSLPNIPIAYLPQAKGSSTARYKPEKSLI